MAAKNALVSKDEAVPESWARTEVGQKRGSGKPHEFLHTVLRNSSF
jgi:hypothetical protein